LKVISCGISSSADLSFSSKYTGEKNGNENPVGRRGSGFRENIDWSRVSRFENKLRGCQKWFEIGQEELEEKKGGRE